MKTGKTRWLDATIHYSVRGYGHFFCCFIATGMLVLH